jgi:hypothetical protein
MGQAKAIRLQQSDNERGARDLTAAQQTQPIVRRRQWQDVITCGMFGDWLLEYAPEVLAVLQRESEAEQHG